MFNFTLIQWFPELSISLRLLQWKVAIAAFRLTTLCVYIYIYILYIRVHLVVRFFVDLMNDDLVLQILGLDICADTIVGNEMLRGISGGQKKRVTTG